MWWTNGKVNIKSDNCPGADWTEGKTTKEKKVKEAVNLDDSLTRTKKLAQEGISKETSTIKPFRIEIFPWMWEVHRLQGEALMVYSLIYNELELTKTQIMEMLQLSKKQTEDILGYLRAAELVQTDRVANKLDALYSVTESSIV